MRLTIYGGGKVGLDMYLDAEIYVPRKNDEIETTLNPAFTEIAVAAGAASVLGNDGHAGITVMVNLAYWRKANAIHGWFVENCSEDGVDDCKPIYVSAEQLRELLDACEKVRDDHSLAESLLPPQEGFFFGSTEIDEWYFADITDTIAQIRAALDSGHEDFVYRASW